MANTKYFRKVFKITQQDIADAYDIPIRTIENWDYRNRMPQYTLNMILAHICTFTDKAHERIRKRHNIPESEWVLGIRRFYKAEIEEEIGLLFHEYAVMQREFRG